MQLILDHVSVLVGSVDTTAKIFAGLGLEVGAKGSFQDIGTEEIYIGDPECQALLLLQAAIGDGPYKRALEKRGTGIHHIAVSTDDFDSFNERLSELGWLVHPASLKGFKKGKTVFYARPGVGAILESITRRETLTGPRLITEVSVRVDPGMEQCINGIGVDGLRCSSAEGSYFVIQGEKWIANRI